jgi:hypothetical protein
MQAASRAAKKRRRGFKNKAKTSHLLDDYGCDDYCGVGLRDPGWRRVGETAKGQTRVLPEDGEVKGVFKGHSKSAGAIRRSWLSSRQGLLHGC